MVPKRYLSPAISSPFHLRHNKKYMFCQSDHKKKKGIIMNHSHQTAIVALAVVIFSKCNYLREKRPAL